jgi:hypothetical protein
LAFARLFLFLSLQLLKPQRRLPLLAKFWTRAGRRSLVLKSRHGSSTAPLMFDLSPIRRAITPSPISPQGNIQNLANKTYVASAGNITDSLNISGQQNGANVLATSTGSIYAGMPRASCGGFLIKF